MSQDPRPDQPCAAVCCNPFGLPNHQDTKDLIVVTADYFKKYAVAGGVRGIQRPPLVGSHLCCDCRQNIAKLNNQVVLDQKYSTDLFSNLPKSEDQNGQNQSSSSSAAAAAKANEATNNQVDPGQGSQLKKSFYPDDVNKALIPKIVTPCHYTLCIRPILNDTVETSFTAPGQVQIVLQCNEVTTQVTIHRSPDLVILEQSITFFQLKEDGRRDTQVDIVGTSYEEANDFFKINLVTNLSPGQCYELSMNFTSQVNQVLAGLYRCEYKTPAGETKHIAVTHFQKFGARMAFPCFDEPGFKTTFDISIGRRKEMNSLCTTIPKAVGVEDPDLPKGWVWDVYNRTPLMSTYLIAIVVSDLVCERADPSIFPGGPIRVWGPAHLIVDRKGGKYPGKVASKLMLFLEKILKCPFQMVKMDLAAVPGKYLRPWAMENWGLFTYRDNFLLFYEGQSTEFEKSLVWAVTAHELAHQWFGNLVTCADWNNIWLNEGLATYMETKYGRVATEFASEREIVPGRLQDSLAYDISKDEPLYCPKGWGSNTVTYCKGSAVIQMMEGFLGEEVLFKGFSDYLNRHAYKQVTQDQFFAVLNEHAQAANKIPADKTVKQIMDTWTLQAGYPVIKVSRVDSKNIYISQQKYLSVKDKPDGVLWEVPIAIATETNPDFLSHTPTLWLNTSGKNWELEAPSSWVVLNADATGFYRVLYDDQILDQLKILLDKNLDNLSGKSRSQLIDDYFSFALLGHTPIDTALDLTKNLDQEDDHIVWFTVFRYFDQMMKMLENCLEMKKYLLSKFEAVLCRALANWTIPLNSIGSGSRVIWLSKMFDRACSLGSEPCRSLALTLFKKWMEGSSQLNELMMADFEPTILCHGVAQLGQVGHDFIMNQYVNADPYGLRKGRFLAALSFSMDHQTVQNFVQENLLDVASLLQKLASTPIHRPFVLKILKEQASLLIGAGKENLVTGVLVALCNFYNSEPELNEVASLLNKLRPMMPSQCQLLDEALTNVQDNIKWMTTFPEPTIKWFSVHCA